MYKQVDNGLISRQEDKNDRRLALCTLTESGQKAAKQLESCYNDFFNQVVDNIPPDDLSGFLVGLKIMVKHLQGINNSCVCAVKKN